MMVHTFYFWQISSIIIVKFLFLIQTRLAFLNELFDNDFEKITNLIMNNKNETNFLIIHENLNKFLDIYIEQINRVPIPLPTVLFFKKK